MRPSSGAPSWGCMRCRSHARSSAPRKAAAHLARHRRAERSCRRGRRASLVGPCRPGSTYARDRGELSPERRSPARLVLPHRLDEAPSPRENVSRENVFVLKTFSGACSIGFDFTNQACGLDASGWLGGALGGIRTPNLLIRRRLRHVPPSLTPSDDVSFPLVAGTTVPSSPTGSDAVRRRETHLLGRCWVVPGSRPGAAAWAQSDFASDADAGSGTSTARHGRHSRPGRRRSMPCRTAGKRVRSRVSCLRRKT